MLLIDIRPRGEMDIIAGFEPAVGGSSPSEDTLEIKDARWDVFDLWSLLSY